MNERLGRHAPSLVDRKTQSGTRVGSTPGLDEEETRKGPHEFPDLQESSFRDPIGNGERTDDRRPDEPILDALLRRPRCALAPIALRSRTRRNEQSFRWKDAVHGLW